MWAWWPEVGPYCTGHNRPDPVWWAVGLLVIHNLVTNLWFPTRWYVPVHVGTAAVLVGLAQLQGRRAERRRNCFHT